MNAREIQAIPQAMLEAEIVMLQNIQKTHNSTSSAWRMASDLLQPMFEEMARRQKAGLLNPSENRQ
jgi:hypothetical protein